MKIQEVPIEGYVPTIAFDPYNQDAPSTLYLPTGIKDDPELLSVYVDRATSYLNQQILLQSRSQ